MWPDGSAPATMPNDVPGAIPALPEAIGVPLPLTPARVFDDVVDAEVGSGEIVATPPTTTEPLDS